VYKKGAGNAFGWELEGRNVNLDRVNESKRLKAIKNIVILHKERP
jgi:hypothetical protein